MFRFETSIEVFDAATSAESWWRGYGDRLVSIATEFGVKEWHYRVHSWGVVVELAFRSEEQWEWFLSNSGVQAALDAIPDPVHGLIIQRGWGGVGNAGVPRKPRPIVGSGAAELPIPRDEPLPADAIGREILRDRELLTRAAS